MARLDATRVGIPKVTNVDASFFNILNTAYYLSGAIAVLIIVIAGFYYVTSAGNAEIVKKAKNAILGAVVGLLVIAMAFAITQFVIKGIEG